jgi:hypothetical protein
MMTHQAPPQQHNKSFESTQYLGETKGEQANDKQGTTKGD